MYVSVPKMKRWWRVNLPAAGEGPLSVVIWTTHHGHCQLTAVWRCTPELDYVLVQVNGEQPERLVLGAAL